MKRTTAIVLAAAALSGALALFALTGRARSAVSPALPFRTIDQGGISYFGYSQPDFSGAEFVINDSLSWAAFWRQHVAGIEPPPPLPAVNFRQEIVLAVILGVQSSGGGPSTEIIDLRTNDCGLAVTVQENTSPGMLDVMTNPYHIIACPKYRGSISFVHHDLAKRPLQD